jgi:signal peptide peptidase SppA
MNRIELLAEFLSSPLALMPERIAALAALILKGTAAQPKRAESETESGTPIAALRRSGVPRVGSVAVIPIQGVISQRGSWWDELFGDGSASTVGIGQSLAEAVNDPGVSQILLDIDSPGGSVYGVAELAAQIRAARDTKPVVAIANSLAASAAYWLGSQASELYSAPGGEVGSIGVWQAHADVSKMFEEAGVKMTLISAGKYKTEGNPYEPLGTEAQKFLQSRVEDYYGDFVKDVAGGRRTTQKAVREGMGQGRVLGADAAKGENMIEGTATVGELLSRMQRAGAQRNTKAEAEQLQLRARLAAVQ